LSWTPRRLPSRDNIAAAVIIASSSSPRPSHHAVPRLLSLQPAQWYRRHCNRRNLLLTAKWQCPASRSQWSAEARWTAWRQTAPSSHNHHLDYPRCHAPPFHLPSGMGTIPRSLSQDVHCLRSLVLSNPFNKSQQDPDKSGWKKGKRKSVQLSFGSFRNIRIPI